MDDFDLTMKRICNQDSETRYREAHTHIQYQQEAEPHEESDIDLSLSLSPPSKRPRPPPPPPPLTMKRICNQDSETRYHTHIQYQQEAEPHEESDIDLSLSLSPPSKRPRPPPPPPPQFYVPPPFVEATPPSSSSTRARYNPKRVGKNEIIPRPFIWATNRRATVHTLNYLLDKNINTISGEVQCKRCGARRYIRYNLESKFGKIGTYICKNKVELKERAPSEWMNPRLPDCEGCKQPDCMKPVMSLKKRSINWLFLLLGNLLGCCSLDQLKYFCKHTKKHRTGAKNRVLFYAYLGLCKQLDPDGPFHVPDLSR